MVRHSLPALMFFATCVATLHASPVTVKELDLMIRMHNSDDEIVAQVTQRHLLTPIDAVTSQKLTADGASAALISKLTSGNFAVSAAEANAIQVEATQQNERIAREKAQDEAAYHSRASSLAITAAPSDGMVRFLDGKLTHMENGTLRPMSSGDLRNVKYFGFYFSALWCGPCRQFTPKLVNYYRQQKAQHPEFEIIFVSNDHSAAGMEEYMKKDEMPWPAVRYDAIDGSIKQLGSTGIPWLIVVDSAGHIITPNSGNPQHPKPTEWSSPVETLATLNSIITTPAR